MSADTEVETRFPGFTFHDRTTRGLTRRHYDELQALRLQHYRRELVSHVESPRDWATVGTFVGSTSLQSLRNLNRLVGKPKSEPGSRYAGQRYANQRIATATDRTGQLRAAFRYNNNASSAFFRDDDGNPLERTPLPQRVAGNVEIAAKLHLPFSIKGRDFLAARHFVVEEIVHDNTVTGLDLVLVGATAARMHNRQPSDAYPFEEETGFRERLATMGYLPTDAVSSVPAFGPAQPAAELEHWQIGSVEDLRMNLYGIAGMSRAISQTQLQRG